MPRQLDWSIRAQADRDRILLYYAETVSPRVAADAFGVIVAAAERLLTRPVLHRPGKHGTRECVLKRFPYTIVYRASGNVVRIVRILHQARAYFN